MSADIERIRVLAEQVGGWAGATDEARRLAAVIWREAGTPAPAGDTYLSSVIAQLTGQMRRTRYQQDPDIAIAVNELRRLVAAAEDAHPAWDSSPHDLFAARTRAACRDAGLDLTQP